MQYHNLRIKSSNGTFYESLKSLEEGTVEFTTKSGDKRYHKEYPELCGTLYSVNLKEVEWDTGCVELLEINLNHNDEAWQLSIPVMDARGVSDWAIQAAYFLDQLNEGDSVKIGLNRKEKDKSGKYLKRTMFFRVDDTPLKRSFTKEEVPQWTKKTVKDKVTKKEKEEWDTTDYQAFFYDVIQRNADRLKVGQREEAPVESGYDGEEDSLPF